MYQLTSLPNGWRIATAELPHLESLTLSLSVPVGSRYETPEQAGAAHFVEHLLFKGTEKRSPRQLTLDVEGIGGSINAFTSEDQTSYEMRGPADLLPHLSEVMADMVFHSIFPDDEIDRERQVIEEEIILYRESPSDHLNDLASQSVFGTHPLGRPITGDPTSLAGLSRAQLVPFWQTHYHQSGGVIAVAGGIEHAQVVDLLAPLLPAQVGPASAQPPRFASPQGPLGRVLEDRDIEQYHLAFGFLTPGRHASDRYALKLMSILLGETMSSRLFQEIREELGLCYHIGSDLSEFDEVGALHISAGLDLDRLDEATEAILKVLEKLRREGPQVLELEQAKRYLLGQSRVSFESSATHADWLTESILDHGQLRRPEESRAKYQAVTRDEIHALAEQLLDPNRMAVALIGPDASKYSL